MITILNLEMPKVNGHGGFKFVRNAGSTEFPKGSPVFIDQGRKAIVSDLPSFYFQGALPMRVIRVVPGTDIAETIEQLRAYCEANDWCDWDSIRARYLDHAHLGGTFSVLAPIGTD